MAKYNNSTLGLLKWFFTPIKLYGGDERDVRDAQDRYEADVASIHGSTAEEMAANGYSGRVGVGLGGEVGLTEEARAKDAIRNRNISQAVSEFGLKTNFNFEFNTPYTDMAFNISEIVTQENLAVREDPIGYRDRVSTPAPYTDLSGATLVENYKNGTLVSSTVSVPNSYGGWNVTINTPGFVDTVDTYTTNRDGTIEQHSTTLSIGNTSFSYDTHYWDGNNTQFGFAAETVIDLTEILGINKQLGRAMAATTEIGMLFFNVAIPSIQALSAGLNVYKYSKLYGMLSIGIGILGLYETLEKLNSFIDNPSILDVSNNILGGFDDSGHDLNNVVTGELFNEDFLPSLTSSGNMRLASSMLPNINNKKQLIKPVIKDNNMTSQQAVFVDYRGGLSEILAPNLIGANEGSIYENISIDKGIMESQRKGTISTLTNISEFFVFLPNDRIFSDTYNFSITYLGNFAYLTSENPDYTGVYQLRYTDLTGNATVTDLVQVQLNSGATDPDVDAVGSEESDRELWEEYTYAYTYYDRDTGFESAPKFSDTILKKTKELDIDNISFSPDTNVDVIRLYRLGGNSDLYRLIIEIDNSANTGTTAYRDSLTEEYSPVILDTQNLVIVSDLKQLTEHKGTLFGFKSNVLYFTRPGKPNMWSEFNTIRVGGAISGIASTPLGLLVMTSNSQTYLVGGTDKYNFSISTLTKSVGCISSNSIANLKNTALWLDYEGLQVSVGSSVSNISKEKMKLDDIGNIKTSLVYDNVYYLIGTNYSVAIDFRYNVPSFNKIIGLEYLTVHKGKLYGKWSDGIYEDILDNVGDYLTLKYKAPKFVGNSYDILTEFEKINITYKGTFSFEVYLDGENILEGDLDSNTIKVEEIKLPTDKNEGLGLEFYLQGTGEVLAFRYIFSNVNTN